MVKNRHRMTGIDAIGKLAWGSHVCQLYQTKEDLIDILVPFFKTGLQNNEFCIWITSIPLQLDEARTALAKEVENLDNYATTGQMEIMDDNEWYTKMGKFDGNHTLMSWIDKEKWALDNGFDGIRFTGNMFWLERRDWKNFMNYEAALDSLITGHRILALCTYATDKCGSSELVDVVSNHRLVLVHREEKWELIRNARRAQVSTLRSNGLRQPGFVRELGLSRERDSFLTIREVSKILNVHTSTIRKWVDKGILRHYRISQRGDLRFKQKDLDNFISKMPSTGIKWHRWES